MDAWAGLGLLVTSVLGRLANKAARRLVPSRQLLDGFPRWRWLLSVATQAVVFPTLVGLAWLFSGQHCGLQVWLMAPASSLSAFERWYVYALFASQTRDMFPLPAKASFMMKLHHWVVVIACVLSLMAPHGFGLFVLGTFVLEVGSMTFNMRVLYSGSKAIEVLYQTCMLASNLAAVAVGILMLQMPGIPLWMKSLYFVADVGVCLGRQRHALKDAGLLGAGRRRGAPGGAGPEDPLGGLAPAPAPPTAAAAAVGRRNLRRGRAPGLGLRRPAAWGRLMAGVGLPLLVGRRWLGLPPQSLWREPPHGQPLAPSAAAAAH